MWCRALRQHWTPGSRSICIALGSQGPIAPSPIALGSQGQVKVGSHALGPVKVKGTEKVNKTCNGCVCVCVCM